MLYLFTSIWTLKIFFFPFYKDADCQKQTAFCWCKMQGR